VYTAAVLFSEVVNEVKRPEVERRIVKKGYCG